MMTENGGISSGQVSLDQEFIEFVKHIQTRVETGKGSGILMDYALAS